MLWVKMFSSRSDDQQDLLLEIAHAGAFADVGRDYLLGASAVSEAEALRQAGFIEIKQNGLVSLTRHAGTLLIPSHVIKKKSGISQFRRKHTAPEKLSTVELMLSLTKAGWTDELRVRGARLSPHTPTHKQVWYRQPDKMPSKNYLRVLLEVSSLFKQGLRAVYHFQIESQLAYQVYFLFSFAVEIFDIFCALQSHSHHRYYLALLNCRKALPDIEPNQPQSYYLNLMNGKNSSSAACGLLDDPGLY